MSKRLFRWLSLAVFTCGTLPELCANYPTIEAFENKRVAEIDIAIENLPAGSTFDKNAVLAKLKTKSGDPFSQATFDSDLKTLSEEYDRVEPSIDVRHGDIYIRIAVWPRPKINKISWKGNHFIGTRALRKELGIKPGATFRRQKFNAAFNKLKEYYIKKGFFESQLEYTVELDPKTNKANIVIEIREGRAGVIDDIIFEGFTEEEQDELFEKIYTRKYSLFTSWISGQGKLNEEAIEQDKITVNEFLQNKGYADAMVYLRIDDAETPGKIVVVLHAERGQLYHFGRIAFKGNHLFTNEEIERCFLVRPEGVYSPEKLRDTAQCIKDLYGRKGYIETIVDYDIQLVHNEPIYNVNFSIEEGGSYKVGLIRILGNVSTQDTVILRESLLVPGETFDSAKLKATQYRLENIGYFKKVNVYAVRTQDDEDLGENYRDVFIEVEETTTGSISAFSGFSSAESVFGGLELSETNFNFKGIPNLFSCGLGSLRGGGEYLHIRANLGKKQTSYTLSWMTPYFRDTLWRVGFDVARTHSTVQAKHYVVNTTGGSIFANYPVTNLWTFGLRYRVRDSDVTTSHGAPPKERKEAKDSDGIISALGSSMGFDSTDSMIKPHNGLRSLIEGEYAGIGGDAYFARFAYVNTYYSELWPHGIMKYRFDLRFILPLFKTDDPKEIPISERFFLGGEGSVRGYKAYDLGPHFKRGDPTGGISSALLSIEYLHEILKILDGFVFADAGSVSLKRFRPAPFRMSWGFGIRLEVMNRVPIVLGYGFPVNPAHKREVQRFYFSMGGQF